MHPLVYCSTSKGDVTMQLRFDWAPIGAMRFLELIEDAYFTNNIFYRVPPIASNPIVQFGLVNKAKLRSKYESHPIHDDEAFLPAAIKRGYVSYGGSGVHSRTSHMWIARQDSNWLGKAYVCARARCVFSARPPLRPGVLVRARAWPRRYR